MIIFRERDAPPRFAQSGTFEEEFSRRWKALDDLEKHQREQLDKNIQAAKEKLEMEMENAIQEHRNMLMKQGTLNAFLFLVIVSNVYNSLLFLSMKVSRFHLIGRYYNYYSLQHFDLSWQSVKLIFLISFLTFF